MSENIEKNNSDAQSHLLFLILYALTILLGYVVPEATPVILVIYMIIASIRMLLKSIHILILFMAISLAATIFPPLIIVEIGLALYFIIRRFNFFFKNINAVMLGLFVYIAPIILTSLIVHVSPEKSYIFF